MAWHLNDSVVSGFIDNREKNKVRGELWLAERTTPIRLDLNGNCAGDLAGCLVEFKNPNVKPAEPLPAFPDQIGEAGEITGSRRIWNIPEAVDPGTLTREEIRKFGQINLLYLDWFSETNGFVTVEVTDPEIKISEASFSHEELPQSSSPAVFVHKIDMEQFGGSGKPLDEFGYEKMLQQFDERVRRFEELSEHYKDDPDGDQKIARELDLTIITDDPEDDEDDEEECFDLLDENLDSEDEPDEHPLVSSAFKLPESFAKFGSPRIATLMMKGNFHKLCESTMEAAFKLENALTPVSNRDPGLIIALLKRALREYHTALEALEKAPKIPTKLRDQWRNEILRIREQILSEMSTYRKTTS